MRTFVPTLTIHRVHVLSERRSAVIKIEMTDGSLMFVDAYHQFDRIEVVLEYGQRVDVWLCFNFPIRTMVS